MDTFDAIYGRRAVKHYDSEHELSEGEIRKLMEAARRNGLLVGKGGLYGNVIRISPPMNIGRNDVDEFIRLLDAAFAETTL